MLLISENPCPQQGNIVTIRLSENKEAVDKGDGIVEEMLVDTYFEMNYATGEWRRYKKYKPMWTFTVETWTVSIFWGSHYHVTVEWLH